MTIFRLYLPLLLLILALLLGACVAAPPAFDEEKWQKTVAAQTAESLYAPNRKNGAFFNPWNPMQEKSLGQFLRWRFSRTAPYTEAEKTYLPDVIPDLDSRIQALGDHDFITWIGHATFLFRVNRTFWLTDPILSKRALLPARLTPPALDMDVLSSITAPLNVVISHSHYDHLDKATIAALPAHAAVYVPLGLGDYVGRLHDGKVQEMDWWEQLDLGNGTSLTCLPAQHWSRRIGQDFNTTLWTGYLLQTMDMSVYYVGDSGYFAGFQEIGRRFPGIDYVLMPLTAYHPRWFMHYAHMNAPESIQAFQDLGAGFYIPTQWGTFRLGDNPPGLPALDLKRTLERLELDPAPYLIMDIGEIRLLDSQKLSARGRENVLRQEKLDQLD
jgi:N-acyl-phosphatidylethanolamine-hydrolysing phospholipase D